MGSTRIELRLHPDELKALDETLGADSRPQKVRKIIRDRLLGEVS